MTILTLVMLLAKVFKDYGPLVQALIRFVEGADDAKIRATAMDELTRELHYAAETGNSERLELAIRRHCTSSGCRIP